MTAKELQKRGAKAENLRVLQTDDGAYFCESEEGKILYNVAITDNGMSCTCGDFARNSKKEGNSNARCKHILSVLNCIPTGEVEAPIIWTGRNRSWTRVSSSASMGMTSSNIRDCWTWPTRRVLPRSRLRQFSFRLPRMGTLPYAKRTWFPNRGRATLTSEMPRHLIPIPRWQSICSVCVLPGQSLVHLEASPTSG